MSFGVTFATPLGPSRRCEVATLRCPSCQHENRPQAKFCEECAAALAGTCANCGARLSATAKFCPECARPAAEPASPKPRFASPEAYTPKHLAEKILTSRSALEG